jgi:hypothetical protein
MDGDPADRIVELHHLGKTPRQIAAALGCSITVVGDVLVAVGIKRRAHTTFAALRGENLTDPNRADRLLRKFSWEDA